MANVLSILIVAILIGFGLPAAATELSTSIMRPSPLDPVSGSVSGSLPGGDGVKIYYLSADLTAGSLITQLQITGRSSGRRELTLELLGPDAKRVESTYVLGSSAATDETTKTFEIDATGRHVFRILVAGGENGRFCILFGGGALPTANAQNCSATSASRPAPPAQTPVLVAGSPSQVPVAPEAAPTSPSGVSAELSTSILRPTPVESLNGAIYGKLLGATAKTYYLSADVEAGDLLAQFETSGRAGGVRRLDLELLGADGKSVASAYLTPGPKTRDEGTRAFPIGSPRRAVLRLIVEGEETGDFCVLFGGAALPNVKPQPCPYSVGLAVATNPDEFSPSIFQPSPADSGLVAGKLPGGAAVKYYYLSADLTPGSLITQLQITGHGSHREMSLELLGPDAKPAESTYVLGSSNLKDETTRIFAIDSTGRRLMRLIVEGDATGAFCLLMGGTALPAGGAQECPTKAAVAAPVASAPPQPVTKVGPLPAPPKNFEIIVTKCEERVRVRSDFLFDFDRAELFPEANSALRELAHRSDLARGSIMVEGHTDGKGSDAYNQRLSERRAEAVRAALIDQGMFGDDLLVHGFGKSRPIAPNQNSDGSDNPEGRQKNRRVELVVNTCG